MKKKYVAPASALLTLNFNENIAASSISETEVSGGGTISFTHSTNGCRMYYTGDMTAQVDVTCSTYYDYWDDIKKNKYDAIWLCYSPHF